MLSYKVVLLALLSSACARPLPLHPVPRYSLAGREVPQEHSHEKILTAVRTSLQLDNPDQISDPVFGLLGNAAAQQGAGNIADATCLQQATADQAFTNAKAADDVEGMTNALIYRALERNSGQVGATTDACTSITAVNAEIAAIQQHQDPASDGAAETNKAIALELAVQIDSIGGDPQRALDSGTFAPGDVNDATAKGNTCDDQNDPEGCIFTQDLLVPDATAEEIDAAVAAGGASGAASSGANNASDDSAAAASGAASATATEAAASASESASSADNSSSSCAATSGNATSGANNASDSASDSASSATASGDLGDFGSCTVPQIEFGVGFDNRKETSFRPTDLQSFNHGSAQNIGIITQFICDQLVNSCGADQTAKDTCAAAKDAAAAENPKDGAAADAFNAVLGGSTNFADVQAIDDQGNAVAAAARRSVRTKLSREARLRALRSASIRRHFVVRQNIGDFGSCTTPEIEFGAGFDNRKETSFQPADLQSFNHGSAQNIDIITQFICDTLTNSCGADQTAKDTCQTARAAASAATAKTGAQADAFNAAFNIQSDFASVTAIDNQGNAVAGSATGANASTGASDATSDQASADCGSAATASAAASSATSASSSSDNTANSNTGNTGNSASSGAATAQSTAASSSGSTSAASGGNLQTFTGDLGGAPPTVTPGGRGFVVEGSDDFLNVGAALGRSCDIQHNACANAANSGGDFSVGDCDAQNTECRAATA